MLKKFSFFLSFFFISIQSSFAEFETGYADLVEKLLPSVVSIVTTQLIDCRNNFKILTSF